MRASLGLRAHGWSTCVRLSVTPPPPPSVLGCPSMLGSRPCLARFLTSARHPASPCLTSPHVTMAASTRTGLCPTSLNLT